MSKHSETGMRKKPASSASPLKTRAPKSQKVTVTVTSGDAGDRHAPFDNDMRRAMIAEAAYYRAERRGFVRGHELQDWLEAEAEIDLILPGIQTH